MLSCQVCNLEGIGDDEDGRHNSVLIKEHILLCSLSQKHDLEYIWEVCCEPFAETDPDAAAELTHVAGAEVTTLKIIIHSQSVDVIRFKDQRFQGGSYNLSLTAAYQMLDHLLEKFI